MRADAPALSRELSSWKGWGHVRWFHQRYTAGHRDGRCEMVKIRGRTIQVAAIV